MGKSKHYLSRPYNDNASALHPWKSTLHEMRERETRAIAEQRRVLKKNLIHSSCSTIRAITWQLLSGSAEATTTNARIGISKNSRSHEDGRLLSHVCTWPLVTQAGWNFGDGKLPRVAEVPAKGSKSSPALVIAQLQRFFEDFFYLLNLSRVERFEPRTHFFT